jgi:hypothetical protein
VPVRRSLIAILAVAAGCGDNVPGVGPDLAPAGRLFITAHRDDEMVFMEPELLSALHAGPVTTIYVATGDPEGLDHSEQLLAGARYAYGSVVGSDAWDCGYLAVEDAPVHHCRLRDRPVSLVELDLPDGGLSGAGHDSLLHLVEGEVTDLPIMGPLGGRATRDQIIAELASVIAATAPDEIDTLDVAATHGRDHSGHLMTSSFTLWALASIGYTGELRWHRGYNVGGEEPTLPDIDYAPSAGMLGYYEACYFGCGPCGTSCATLDPTHELWIRRQYGYERAAPTGATATLASADGSTCASVAPNGELALGDCAAATPVRLEPWGHLVARELCAASRRDGSVAFAPCAAVPEQYWLLDSEGHLWNGAPPDASAGMDYDHVRCMAPDAAGAIAPTCGADLQPTWRFL